MMTTTHWDLPGRPDITRHHAAVLEIEEAGNRLNRRDHNDAPGQAAREWVALIRHIPPHRGLLYLGPHQPHPTPPRGAPR